MTNAHNIRKLKPEDLDEVLALIREHDEDDAEYAMNTLLGSNSNNIIAEKDGVILGVSGYENIIGTDRTAYLSWTYVLKSKLREGIGRSLLNSTLSYAKNDKCRLMVLKVSDYTESDSNVSIYEGARQLYINTGFKTQMICPNFYDKGEAVEIMTIRLADNDSSKPNIKDEKPRIRFSGLREIVETNGAYAFDWTVETVFFIMKNRNFSVQDLEIGLDAAINNDARVVFLTFPSNLPLIHNPLQESGFKFLGKIKDYYEDGVDELHFIKDLS